MAVEVSLGAGPVAPTPSARTRLRPIETGTIRLDGFWADRLHLNRERTIPHGFRQIQRAGNLDNFRLAAGGRGDYRALGMMFEQPFPFLDSDVYKWLEAVGWELGTRPDPDLARSADEAIELIALAQRGDGYVNTFVQVLGGGNAYRDLAWGHELYCTGHLIQAAVAWHRALGDDRLLAIASRAADSVDRELGPSGRAGIDGHPEIEMALVELFRVTAEQRYLDLATRFIEARGHGLLGGGRFGAAYWQDHAPVREAAGVAGHSVRQLYLDCGAVDVAVERGDDELLDAVRRRWRDMIATRTYLTGGLGSRHRDEAFGDPFELPPDGAYAETCAAIASVMLAWRLLLATGEPEHGDVIERTIYNGVLPGVSLDGTDFFYVNTLQRRTVRAAAGPEVGQRAAWFPCACCPPNLMRLLASWPHYLATTDEGGIQLHQYATGQIEADVPGGRARVAVETGYPWDGTVTVRVLETPEGPWALSMRVPGWSSTLALRGANGQRLGAAPGTDEGRGVGRMVTERRSWRAGDSISLELEMTARVTHPDPRIDAIRGCVAFERGPLVYCIEGADLPGDAALEDVELTAESAPSPVERDDLAPGVVGLAVEGVLRDQPTGRAWPYSANEEPASKSGNLEVRAIPYFSWANRSVEAMRVWIPLNSEAPSNRER